MNDIPLNQVVQIDNLDMASSMLLEKERRDNSNNLNQNNFKKAIFCVKHHVKIESLGEYKYFTPKIIIENSIYKKNIFNRRSTVNRADCIRKRIKTHLALHQIGREFVLNKVFVTMLLLCCYY